MKHRVNTAIACALLIGALAAPASEAGDQRTPHARHHVASQVGSSAFAGLGHEGSGLRKSQSEVGAFANLGHEGSGLVAQWEAAKIRPWAA
jgi:hypothetical protein